MKNSLTITLSVAIILISFLSFYFTPHSDVVLLVTLTSNARHADQLKQIIQRDVHQLKRIVLPHLQQYTNGQSGSYEIFSAIRNGKKVIFCLINNHTPLPECLSLQQILINNYKISSIIFFAAGGGLKDNSQVGDIYIPSIWYYYDRGLLSEQKFITLYEMKETRGQNWGESVQVDKGLLSVIANIDFTKIDNFIPFDNKKLNVKVGGAGITGNSWLDSKTRRNELVDIFNADVVDMRAAGLLESAEFNRIPMVYIASIIDFAGKESLNPGDSWKFSRRVWDKAIFNSYLVALKILDTQKSSRHR